MITNHEQTFSDSLSTGIHNISLLIASRQIA